MCSKATGGSTGEAGGVLVEEGWVLPLAGRGWHFQSGVGSNGQSVGPTCGDVLVEASLELLLWLEHAKMLQMCLPASRSYYEIL